MEKLTDEEKDMLKYFWQEKGDLERYVDFEVLRPKIEVEYPQVLKAWQDYKTSIAILDAVIDSL